MFRPTWHQVFMHVVEIIAERSTCLEIKTAAIIVENKQIKAIGHNGTITGAVECCDHWTETYETLDVKESFLEWMGTDEFTILHDEWSRSNEIHAEMNALKWVSCQDTKDKDYIMYCLYSPCDMCAKEIIEYGIKTLYYKYDYKYGANALETLAKHKVDCFKLIH